MRSSTAEDHSDRPTPSYAGVGETAGRCLVGAWLCEPALDAATGTAFRLVEPLDEVVEVEAHVAAEFVMRDLLLACLFE